MAGIELVDLSGFWSTYQDIEKEYSGKASYDQVSAFWTAYLQTVNSTSGLVRQANGNLSSSLTGESAGAFQNVLNQAQSSLQSQAKAIGTIPQLVQTLPAQLDSANQTAQAQKSALLALKKVSGFQSTGLLGSTETIQDGEATALVDQATASQIDSITATLTSAHQKLADAFTAIAAALEAVPDQQWIGPGSTMGAGAAPAKSAGAGGGATPSSSGGGGAGSASGDGSDPSTTDPTSSADSTDSAADPGNDSSLAGTPDTTTPLPSDSTSTDSTTPDPTLAGAPTATLPPPGIRQLSTGLNTGLGSLGSPTASPPLTFPPLTFPPPARTSSSPAPVNEPEVSSGGSSSIGDTGLDAAALPAEESVSSQSATAGSGVYPPMMPPMYPGSGGAGSVQPGDADSVGGSSIRWQGRDSWRAGLVPDLQGRGGSGEEPADETRAAAGAQVLDEELWQVSGFAAPVTPPPQAGRGRSRGF